MFMTVGPAYGRDYTSKAKVLADWNADKDFEILDFGPDMGRKINRSQAVAAGLKIMVRYANERKVTNV